MPTIGPIQITWYSGKATGAAPVSKVIPSKPVPLDTPDVAMKEASRPRSPEPNTLHSPHVQEEEVIASGWGEDGDGEDGMGML